MFQGHALTEINIPEGITEIHNWSFYTNYSPGPVTITIPNSVTAILGNQTFNINQPKTVSLPCKWVSSTILPGQSLTYLQMRNNAFSNATIL